MTTDYKRLIASHNNSIKPNGTIGKQKCGINFWQKTGFLQHCNVLGFQAIVRLIVQKFKPSEVQILQGERAVFFTFDDDKEKVIYLMLDDEKDTKHHYIYGESHTAYVNADFHIFVLNFVEYISKQIGSRFYVDDATEYLTNKSKSELENYISDYNKRIIQLQQSLYKQ